MSRQQSLAALKGIDLRKGITTEVASRILKMQSEERLRKTVMKKERAYSKKKVSKNVGGEQLSLFDDTDLFMMLNS